MSPRGKKAAPKENELLSDPEYFRVVIVDDIQQYLQGLRKDYLHLVFSTQQIALKNGRKTTVIAGTFVFLDDGSAKLNIEALKGGEGSYVLLFKREMLDSALQKAIMTFFKTRKAMTRFAPLSQESLAILSYYLSVLYAEYNGNRSSDASFIQSVLQIVIRLCLDNFRKEVTQNDLTEGFVNLLNRQFPITSVVDHVVFKNPKDFARYFNVHVNHLNFELKRNLGKTTSQLIQEKITAEACALLTNTSWAITDIGKVLGFDYPQHFNAFFKKKTGKGPSEFRKKGQAQE